jgi:hypothetical protein
MKKKSKITRFDIFLILYLKNKVFPNKKREYNKTEIEDFSNFLYGDLSGSDILFPKVYKKK